MSRLARLGDWLDERIGHRKLIAAALDEPVRGGARWSYVFGSALTLTFVAQAVTGVLLMTTYAPSASTAWASVHYATYKLSGGWLVRGIHHFGSQAMIVLLGMHLVQVATFGAYKKPREMNWWLGLGLMGVTLGFGLTGYLLPWDQKGYWATRVATNIAGTTPLVGAWLQQLLQGGPDYGNLTLTRFYALHVGVLPASLALLLAAHVALFRRHGVTAPTWADTKRVDRFFPKQLGMDLVAGLVVLGIVVGLAIREHGAPLDAPADPASDYPARPEWYFLPLFELLKHFHGPAEIVGTMVIPALAGAYLFALPLLDKKPSYSIRDRLRHLAPLYAGAAAVAGLTYSAMASDAKDAEFQAQRRVADDRARIANALAMGGVPVEGPLEMMRRDPELRGEALFAKHCATCHVLGRWGDAKKANAAVLDGWGTEAWARATMHEPDSDARFGRTPFAGMMPSVDVAPKDLPADAPPFKPMSEGDQRAAAAFLASQSGGAAPDAALVKAGEGIVTTRCTACHMFKGEGDVAGQGFAPELSGWGSVGWLRAQIANPSSAATYRDQALDPKLKGHMPRFDAEIPGDDVDLLARWVWARSRGVPLAPAPPRAQP
jgi:ubiquinol-cytochrome c reductase cytochrome b subunit